MHLSSRSLLAVALLTAYTAGLAPADEPKAGKVRLVRTLEEPTGRVSSVYFSADGRRLLTNGVGAIRLWDAASGKELVRYRRNEDGYPLGAELSADGRMLAAENVSVDRSLVRHDGGIIPASAYQDDLVILDADSQEVLRRIPHPKTVSWCAFSPDGKMLLSASQDWCAHLWNAANGDELRRMPLLMADRRPWNSVAHPQGEVFRGYSPCGSFAPDGKTIALSLDDGAVWLYNAETGAALKRLCRPADVNQTKHLAFSPDGRLLATGSFLDDAIQLWDVERGTVVRETHLRLDNPPPDPTPDPRVIPKPPRGPGSHSVSFSPDGKTAAVCCGMECVHLLEVATGRVRYKLACKNLRAAQMAPAGRLLVTTDEVKEGEKGSVQFWDWRDPCLEGPHDVGEAEAGRLWDILAGEDATAAYRAEAALLAAGDQGVAALARRLRPVVPADAAEVERVVKALDDDDFDIREKADRRLEELGVAARPALRGALTGEPDAELRKRAEALLARLDAPPGPEALRSLRAVEVLEAAGTAEARRTLRGLANGCVGAARTEDARAALGRLEKE